MKDLYASPAALPSQLKNGARCLQGLLARMALLLALGGLLLQQAQAAVPPRLEQPVRSAESDSLEAVLARLRVQHLLALEGRQYGQDRDRERREWLSAYRAYTLERDALIEAHYARQGKETKQQQSSDGSLSLQSVSGFDLVPDSVELRALRDLYSSTGGEGWTHSTNWLTGTTSADFDTWYGVTVTNGDVTAIILSRNALGDTIPSSLGELSMLSYLHLNGNRLSGPVPECLRSLPELQNLYLGQNSFSGPLPLWLGQLSKLQVLSLHDNALTGGIPESLGNLAALTSLNLDGNRLSGGIPAALGRLTNLLSLYLSFNSLTGPIPDSLANLTRLQHLDFYRNDLGGEVPDWLGDFSDLETLKLRSCGLSGPIPASLGNLSKLYYLSLRGNGLTGGIPESLGNLASMRNLYLSDNSLSGPVPGSLAALAVLENLDLFTNKLEGGLPDFSASPNRSSLNLRVQGNRLGFGVIEPNMTGAGTSAIGTFTYSPQDDIPAPDTLGFTAGQPLELRAVTGGTRNLYQWQRQVSGVWQEITGATDSLYAVPSAAAADGGLYRCRVTNGWATALTLHTESITVSITESQAPDMNYIVTHTLQEAGVTDAGRVAGLSVEKRQQQTVYFDGLGRPIQQVGHQASPGKKDLVTPIAYDAFGRQDRDYLPYASGTNGYYKEQALNPADYKASEQYLFYQQGGAGIATSPFPYAQKVFEASPLNRVTEQGAPGEAWQPLSDTLASSGHTVKVLERANAAGEARLWEVDSTGRYTSPGFYGAGELYVSETRDENGSLTVEYKDKQGRVVQKKVQEAEGADLQGTQESGSTTETASCPEGLAQYWRFGQGSLTDSQSGLTASGTGAAPVTGKLGEGLGFDGTAGLSASGASFDWTAGSSFSIELWVRRSGAPAGNEVIVGRDDMEAGGSLHWWLGLNTSGQVIFQLKDNQGWGYELGAAGPSVTDGTWHHVVAVRNEGAKTNTIYVDGQVADQATGIYYSEAGFASAAALNIGWLNRSSGYHYNGDLDELAFYSRSLASQEASAHYNGGQGMDYCEGAGNVEEPVLACAEGVDLHWGYEQDYVDSKQGLVASGSGGIVVADGAAGSALRFDATGGLSADAGAFDWAAGSSFSIELWVRRSGAPAGNEVVIGRDAVEAGLSSLHWWIGVEPSGKARFQLKDNQGWGAFIGDAAANPSVTDGAWHQVVAVRDGAGQQNLLYVDGVLVQQVSMTYSGSGFASTVGVNMGWLDRYPGFRYNGDLDELALYKRALTAQEVASRYNGGSPEPVCQPQTTEPSAKPLFANTQYVYDALGNLRLVIQPEGYRNHLPTADAAGTVTLEPNSVFLSRWCFRYAYDGRRRLVEKQVPGAGPVETVYNKRDEAVFTRDANQKDRGEWAFVKYDVLGRPVMTGVVSESRSRDTLQAKVDALTGASLYESPDAASFLGYTLNGSSPEGMGIAEGDVLTVTYYDDYSPFGTAYAFDSSALAGMAGKNERVRGQVTGTRTRVLGTGDWLTSVNYYDDKYRLIQTVSDGYVGGAVLAEADRVTTRYDFTGKPLETLTTHRAASGTHAVLDSMRYDHMGRLLESWQAIDGRGAVLLASNKYNEAGQLVDKGLHSTDGGGSFLQSVDYRYNIRGWTSSINNAARTSDGATNDEGGDLFGFELTYNEGMQLGAGAQYNGNVTEAVWSTATDGVQRGYAYAYDRASRLKSGTYKAYDGAGWTAEQGRYTLEGLSYDANGNIKGLVRHGMSSGHAYDGSVPRAFGEVDRLSYVYEGNRLATVNDAVTVTGPAGDFRDNGTKKAYAEGNQASWEYAYDANGNMVRDENKGITSVSYNHLNLPDTVFVKDKGYIRYLYSAAGVKLRKEVYQNSALTSATDYAGVFVHQADTLFAFTPEGRALYEPMTDQVWRYEYHLKDHLGNLRVSFAEPTTTTSGLTMEPMMATTEEAEFENVEQTRHQDRMRARTGSHSALLGVGRGRPLGPSKRVALQKGDTLRVEAFGMYEAERKQSLAFSLASWLASGVALTAPQAVAGEQAGQGKAAVSPLLGVGLAMAPAVLQREKRAPVAYLRYIVYDSDSNYVDSGYRALSSEANGGWEELELAYAAEEDGFAEVYVANESEEEAYFDDMSVSVTSPMLVQENHYDPWGLNLVGLEKQGTPDHKFQYNGKEKQTELGLNWMDYGARMYDAQIGRWHVVDPLADIAPDRTPYHFVSNNPINRIDPTGLTDFTLNKKTGEVAQVGKANDEPDRILKTNRKGEVKYKKNGEAKVAMGGIEQGILADGQNWKTDDQVIEVGGEGQATVDGVKSFTMGLSEYLGKEIKGFSYSSNASGDVTDMVLGKYLNNSNTESYGTLGALQKKYGGNFSFGGVLQEFHTHPDGKLGATQSAPNLSQDVTALQNDKPFIPNASFIILYRIQGQKKPAEYDYTHEYRVPRKKR